MDSMVRVVDEMFAHISLTGMFSEPSSRPMTFCSPGTLRPKAAMPSVSSR